GGSGGGDPLWFSRTPRCAACGIVYPEPHPRLFSFNNPAGACGVCHGLGVTETADENLVVADGNKSLAEGAVAPWEGRQANAFQAALESLAEHIGFSLLTPFNRLDPAHRQVILYGTQGQDVPMHYQAGATRHEYHRPFDGVIPSLEQRYRSTDSPAVREALRRFFRRDVCTRCGGGRLRPEALHFFLGGLNIAQAAALTLPLAARWLDDWAGGLTGERGRVASGPVGEVRSRLKFLTGVGLHYLALDRPMTTLSGGEAQRIRLATQIGSALSGVLYILDEPTIGLHQRDTGRLLDTLDELRGAGNTVVVVEHDRETMARAGYLVEIGPRAGVEGGYLVAQGTPDQLKANPGSTTGGYLTGRRSIPLPSRRRPAGRLKLVLEQVTTHNLKAVTVEIPLGLLVCVTGVSGSGKSSLVLDTLYPALMQRLHQQPLRGLELGGLQGAQALERVIHIDQSSIGRSARSNPATFMGVFSLIRQQFSLTPEARRRGYTPQRFSFNVEGGRCMACGGEGRRRIEMHFMPDLYVGCEACGSTRYNRETLEIRYRGKTIDDVLAMTVEEALGFFKAHPAIRDRLATLTGVGLGYLSLGQPGNTLSGGEAQRLKIARELSQKNPARRLSIGKKAAGEGGQTKGRTLYILDEPTTGLHFEDVERLLDVLNQLVENGHSVVVIEHNLDLIRCADVLVELGPEGGEAGGRLVASGTPEEVAALNPPTHTGRFLAPLL
ncbi:MAG: excinuclease ABC subunit UvrA, partial [Deltaproteobacteria bacterium]|nr:excinuclease ABC subunit UvrA [Deltaproteobacteria bacterium]